MENASKALIIAGAILISILIIGLCVFIYQQAQSTVSKANLNSQEAQAQNQQFDNYFGDKVSAQEVKQLCTTVRSNNITGEGNAIITHYNMGKDIRRFIEQQGGTMPEDLPTPDRSLKEIEKDNKIIEL